MTDEIINYSQLRPGQLFYLATTSKAGAAPGSHTVVYERLTQGYRSGDRHWEDPSEPWFPVRLADESPRTCTACGGTGLAPPPSAPR
jgi:hypothetical protein